MGRVARRTDRHATACSSSGRTRRTGRIAPAPCSSAPSRPRRPALVERLRAYEGIFTSPFREKLLFGKVSLAAGAGPAGRGHLQLAQRDRHPRLRRPGRQQQLRDGRERQQPRRLAPGQVADRRRAVRSTRPTSRTSAIAGTRQPENPDIIGENFAGLLRIGGRDTEQHIVQQRVVAARRLHALPEVARHPHRQGRRRRQLRSTTTSARCSTATRCSPIAATSAGTFPRARSYGVGDPDLSAQQLAVRPLRPGRLGVTPRLTLNLGLRWDYESDMLNNDYVTPDERAGRDGAVRRRRALLHRRRRPAAVLRRLAAARSASRTTSPATAGRSPSAAAGRYYDRVLYNSTLDERFRLQYAVAHVPVLAATAASATASQTIVWDPSYLSVRRPRALIARGLAPNPEVFLIANDAEAAGLGPVVARRCASSFGGIVTSATYTRHAQPEPASRSSSATAAPTAPAA